MKRNWKRILSLWLTVCMVFTMNFGLGATAVYAGTTQDITNGPSNWQIDSDEQTKVTGATDGITVNSGVSEVALLPNAGAGNIELNVAGMEAGGVVTINNTAEAKATVTVVGDAGAVKVVTTNNDGEDNKITLAADSTSNTVQVGDYFGTKTGDVEADITGEEDTDNTTASSIKLTLTNGSKVQFEQGDVKLYDSSNPDTAINVAGINIGDGFGSITLTADGTFDANKTYKVTVDVKDHYGVLNNEIYKYNKDGLTIDDIVLPGGNVPIKNNAKWKVASEDYSKIKTSEAGTIKATDTVKILPGNDAEATMNLDVTGITSGEKTVTIDNTADATSTVTVKAGANAVEVVADPDANSKIKLNADTDTVKVGNYFGTATETGSGLSGTANTHTATSIALGLTNSNKIQFEKDDVKLYDSSETEIDLDNADIEIGQNFDSITLKGTFESTAAYKVVIDLTNDDHYGINGTTIYKYTGTDLEVGDIVIDGAGAAPAVVKVNDNKGVATKVTAYAGADRKIIIDNQTGKKVKYFISSNGTLKTADKIKAAADVAGVVKGDALTGTPVTEVAATDLAGLLKEDDETTLYVYFADATGTTWATENVPVDVKVAAEPLVINDGSDKEWTLSKKNDVATKKDASFNAETLTLSFKQGGDYVLTAGDSTTGTLTLTKDTNAAITVKVTGGNDVSKYVSENGITVTNNTDTTVVATGKSNEYAMQKVAKATTNDIDLTAGTAKEGHSLSVNVASSESSVSLDGAVVSYRLKAGEDESFTVANKVEFIKTGTDAYYFVITDSSIKEGGIYEVKVESAAHYGDDGKIWKAATANVASVTAGTVKRLISMNLAALPSFTYEDDDQNAIAKAIEDKITTSIWTDSEKPTRIDGDVVDENAEVEIYVAPEKDKKTSEQIINTPNSLITDPSWDTDKLVSGNYVAVVSMNKAIIDGTKYTGIVTASANFTINRKKIYIHAGKVTGDKEWTAVTTNDYVASGNFVAYVSTNATSSYSQRIENLSVSPIVYVSANKTALTNTGSKFSAGTVTITPSVNGTLTIKNSGKDVTENYEVVKYVPTTFTVENISESTNIELENGKYASTLYYGEDLGENENVERYVDVYLGTSKKTGNKEIEYKFGLENGKATQKWSEFVEGLDGKYKYKDKVSANTTIYVSANYLGASIVENGELMLTVQPRPVVISANGVDDELSSLMNAELKSTYKGKIDVYEVDYKGDTATSPIKDANDVAIDSWTTSTNMAINPTGIAADIAGDYPITFDNVSLKSDKAYVYTLDSTKGTYTIRPSVVITVKNAMTGETLSENAAVELNADNKTINIVSMNGGYMFSDIRSEQGVFYNEGNNKKYLTVTTYNGGYGFSFDNSNGDRFKLTGNQIIYVIFEEENQITESKTDPSQWVAAIAPVFYTGGKVVASDDKNAYKKGNSNQVIDVTVYANGKTLTYGDDYTLSYKNNVNAANASSKKAPTVIVKGKGDYKKLKIEAKFTILPANLNDIATVNISNTYIKYTGKALKPKINLTYNSIIGNSKKKINSKGYTLRFFDEKGSEVTSTAFAKNAAFGKYTVKAYATGKDANFTGYTDGGDKFFGIPSNSKTLKVSGLINKVKYDGSKIVRESFINTDKFKASLDKNNSFTLADEKIGKISVRLLTEDGYKDAKNGKEVDSDDDITTTGTKDSGTYYIAIGPNVSTPEKLYELGVYETTFKKVTYAGKKLSGLKIAKGSTSFAYDGNEHAVELDPGKLTTDNIILLGSEYDDYTLESVIADGDAAKYSTYAPANKIPASKLSNSDPGTYYIYAVGRGEYSGMVRLTYKVNALKLGKNAPISVNYAGLNGSAYNAAGYDNTKVQVFFTDSNGKATGSALKVDDPRTTLDDKTSAYRIVFNKGGVGKGAGSFTITGTGRVLSGKATYKFDVVKAPLTSATVVARSALKGAKTPASTLVQKATLTYGNGKTQDFTAVLKAGTDYKVTSITEGTSSATAALDASSSKLYSGKRNISYSTYKTEVKSVVINLSSNSVSFNKTGKNYDGTDVEDAGRKAEVTSVVVTMKDGTSTTFVEKAEKATDKTIEQYFNTPVYKDNTSVTKNAKVILTFKNDYGTTYPTGVEYAKTYTITSK